MLVREYCWLFVLQVLGESMAGISQNAKTGDLPAFGECVGIASKALCGLTEAAAQVRDWLVPLPCSAACVLCRLGEDQIPVRGIGELQMRFFLLFFFFGGGGEVGIT